MKLQNGNKDSSFKPKANENIVVFWSAVATKWLCWN